MLQQLCENDDLFLNISITITEDKRTDFAKNDENNVKLKAIDSAHIRRDKLSIGFAQRRCYLTYSMSSAFNRQSNS